jgi:hypothetical protein
MGTVGLNFAGHFMGIVEKDVPATSLGRWTLLYTAGDEWLIKVLGGEAGAAVPFLAYVHQAMARGEQRAGHIDWRSNFAYIRSPVDHRLWAVHWTVDHANEWVIGAVAVPNPHLDWQAGSLVLSRRTPARGAARAAAADAHPACAHKGE